MAELWKQENSWLTKNESQPCVSAKMHLGQNGGRGKRYLSILKILIWKISAFYMGKEKRKQTCNVTGAVKEF